MRKIIFIVLAFMATSVSAQEWILKQIEENNTLLSSLRSQTEAEKIGNKTGIYPENPEVEAGYSWGNEKEMGNRIDFSVSQSFDFPTSYYHKKKLSDIRNSQADIRYQIERKNILLEAKNICIQLVYQNALSARLKEQMDLTQSVADAYSRKFEIGEASSLDLNKAKYDYINAQKDYNNSIIEKEYLLTELQRLNGGKPVEYSTLEFQEAFIPLNFQSWYESQEMKNYALIQAGREVNISKESEKLQRALNLPKFSAGYMSEKVKSEHFQGVTVGMSIPLWENKNTVRQIKAQTLANEQLQSDVNMQNYYQTEALYKKAVNLKQMVDDFDRFQQSDKTVSLLKKALDKGELSLINYILELGIYYEMVQSKLETQRDLQLVIAELMQWDL